MTGLAIARKVVILDGLNIARARSFCGTNTTPGSALALKMAIDHFLSAAHDVAVHVILPAWAMDGGRDGRSMSRLVDGSCAPGDGCCNSAFRICLFTHAISQFAACDPATLCIPSLAVDLLTPYLDASPRVIHLAPSGIDEDDFILCFAIERDAMIVSNDLYRDKHFVSREWIKTHRVGFMFAAGQFLVQPSRVSSPPSPVKHECGKSKILADTSAKATWRGLGRGLKRAPTPDPGLDRVKCKEASIRPYDRKGKRYISARSSGPSMRELLLKAHKGK